MIEINNDDMWTIIHALDYSIECDKEGIFPSAFDEKRAEQISNDLCEMLRLSDKDDEKFKANISEAA
ncbi:MAG: hypothetical protein ACU836_14980 [Gammaproteobacteria bacterium]